MFSDDEETILPNKRSSSLDLNDMHTKKARLEEELDQLKKDIQMKEIIHLEEEFQKEDAHVMQYKIMMEEAIEKKQIIFDKLEKIKS